MVAKEVSANLSADSTTRTRVPPGSVTNANLTTTPTFGRAVSARTSTKTPTIPTIGSARAVSRTLPTGTCASSAKRQTLTENRSQAVVKALAVAIPAAVKALAAAIPVDDNSHRIGIAPAAA